MHGEWVAEEVRERIEGPTGGEIAQAEPACGVGTVACGAADGIPERSALGDPRGGDLHAGGVDRNRAALLHEEVDEFIDRDRPLGIFEAMKQVRHSQARFGPVTTDPGSDGGGRQPSSDSVGTEESWRG